MFTPHIADQTKDLDSPNNLFYFHHEYPQCYISHPIADHCHHQKEECHTHQDLDINVLCFIALHENTIEKLLSGIHTHRDILIRVNIIERKAVKHILHRRSVAL